jgi:NADPH:quinone reductase-like Zn-dependent oxidoreductase
MKAVIFSKHGGPEQLQFSDVPIPQIHDDEVLVRVRACALNHLDIWVRQGLPGVTLPHILGCESAGTVETVGKKVTAVSKGQRVLIAPGICCGKCDRCREGWDSMCDSYKVMGYQVFGGYAEFVKCPAENVLPITEKWSFEEWAAVPLDFLTAWHMLFTRAALKKGESVLIHAAGSGVGSAAIQLAKWKGATVFTTASTDEKLALGQSLGADHIINYKKEDFAHAVRRITKKKGVDVVLEHIGPDTWEKSLASLSKLGRLVTCGATSGPTVTMDLRLLFVRQLSISGCYMGGRKELAEVMKLVADGTVRPVVDKTFPLAEAASAHQRMLDRKNIGKIVLGVSS